MFAFHNRNLKSTLVSFMHLLMVFPAMKFRHIQWTGMERDIHTDLMTCQAYFQSNNLASLCQPEVKGETVVVDLFVLLDA